MFKTPRHDIRWPSIHFPKSSYKAGIDRLMWLLRWCPSLPWALFWQAVRTSHHFRFLFPHSAAKLCYDTGWIQNSHELVVMYAKDDRDHTSSKHDPTVEEMGQSYFLWPTWYHLAISPWLISPMRDPSPGQNKRNMYSMKRWWSWMVYQCLTIWNIFKVRWCKLYICYIMLLSFTICLPIGPFISPGPSLHTSIRLQDFESSKTQSDSIRLSTSPSGLSLLPTSTI